MNRRAFDEFDLRVYEAHSLADGQGAGDGRVATWQIKEFHRGPLPAQRLAGMARRGLLRNDWGFWTLTYEGIRRAEAFKAEPVAEHVTPGGPEG